jgi:hypothetical protein
VLVRVRIGRWLTPWIASGALYVDGERCGPAWRGRARLARHGEHTLATIPMADGPLTLELTAPSSSTVRWDYASPAGRGREVDHCSVGDGEIALGQRR